MKINFSIFLLTSMFALSEASIQLKEHEQWWQSNCHDQKTFDQFAGWIGDESEPSRVYMRNYIIKQSYESLLDIPCGLCVDFFPLKRLNPELIYLGVDITPLFVDRARSQSIPVLEGRIQNIPCADSSFDVTYSRHILEHLDSYEEALKELIRVAKKEVLVVFFIKPHNAVTHTINEGRIDGYLVYHNTYSKKQIESFLTANPKVVDIEWDDVTGTDECVLHVFLK